MWTPIINTAAASITALMACSALILLPERKWREPLQTTITVIVTSSMFYVAYLALPIEGATK